MISLNERDADRIAMFLRELMKELDDSIAADETMTTILYKFIGSSDRNRDDIATLKRKSARTRAKQAEIGELLVLLVTGSGE